MPARGGISHRDARVEDLGWSRPVDDRPDGQVVTDARFTRDAQAWAQIYDQTDVRSIIHQRRLSRALRVIDGLTLPAAPSVLEVGCGAGLLTTALARRGARLVSLDRVAPMLDFARGRLRRAGLEDRAALIRADAASLPFPAGKFHLIVALGLVMWVPSPELALQEMSRVLEPGGLILINASNRLGLTRWLDPIANPFVVPLKPAVQGLLRRLGLWRPR